MNYGKQLHKEADLGEKGMADMGSRMLADMEKQKNLLPILERRLAEVDSNIKALQRRIGDRPERNPEDATIRRLQGEYFDAIATRDELEKAVMVTEESIAEAQTLYTRGLPEDDTVLGPNS